MVFLGVGGIGVAHLAVRLLERQLVVEERLVHPGLLGLDVRVDVAALEDRPADGRTDRAVHRVAVDELAGLQGLESERAVDVELRIPHRLRDADRRDLGRELAFGDADVRPAADEVERQRLEAARRDQPGAVGTLGEARVARPRHFAGEDRQRVLVRLLLRQQRRDARTRLLDDIGALVDRQLVADARVEAGLHDVVGLGLEDEVRARDRQALLGRA